jgi:CxxC motif-containing protein (DUF1111 family)
MDAFGAGFITDSMVANAHRAGASDIVSIGGDMFSRDLVATQFLGPLFNGRSCNDCHNTPATGGASTTSGIVKRIAKIDDDGNFQLVHGGVARNNSIRELGFPCGLPTGVPPEATIVSPRDAMSLRGVGLIDNISLVDVVNNQNAEDASIRGHVNTLADGRIGKFGWKADIATLVEFMADAFRTEQGITNPLRKDDLERGCFADFIEPYEIDALPLQAVVSFMNTLDPPAPAATCLASPGATVFANAGCVGCHKPSFSSEGKTAQLYSDLLLHDMGPGLADNFPDNSASGSEFRTMPLWRVSDRPRFLHDGRATTIDQAIEAHGGQAATAQAAYSALSASDQAALLAFLGCI